MSVGERGDGRAAMSDAAAAPARAVRTGEAVYDTLLCAHGRLHPAWPLHLGRLRRDAERMGLGTVDLAELVARIDAAWCDSQAGLPASEPTAIFWRLRVDIYAAAPAGLQGPVQASAISVELGPSADRVRAPCRVALGPRLRCVDDPLAGVKRAATPSARALRRIAAEAGNDEVLLRDVDGRLSEATTASLLVGASAGVALTPAPASAPLRSTTVAMLLATGGGGGVEIREEAVDVAAVDGARWALLVNAVAGGRVVAEVEGVALPPPPAALIAHLRELVDGGPAADRAVAALAAGRGPAWAVDALHETRETMPRLALSALWRR